MPTPAAPLPSELGRTFTCADAQRAGVSPGRLRAKDLRIPFRGVRTVVESQPTACPPILDDAPLARDRALRSAVLTRAREYDAIMAHHAFFTGRTAAVLYDAPIDHAGDLEVGVFAPARAPRREGIRGRKVAVALASTREHLGLRVTSPGSTWAMLGAEMSVRDLVRLGDAFVRVPRDDRGRRQPREQRATLDQLRAAVDAGSRPGAARLREALELIRVGSASPLETDYRLDAAAAGLPDPQLDVEIFDAHGFRIGITEIVYDQWRVVVEIEGDHHRTSRDQWNRDIEKHAAYVAEGWEVIRLTSGHIRGAQPRAVPIVRSALARRGWQHG
ncbi:hypothetical protein [Microbacterium pygmaeum]|uniref:DUF559 domain-containing protein n=1 Tax=Microbacterium pygmaeum TaxID=370764 RepID=A0A1G7WMP8_9MICO|nr:hypothetical protein [Microbacterium pygmaeum]SDG73267.1 hypothetical protein SAMN04489810_1138 [Microbacterium pygmaeum]